MSIYDAPLCHVKTHKLQSVLFSELRYMSNGLTFEMLDGIARNFLENNGYKIS